MPGMDYKEVPTLALPFIYDIQNNSTTLAERKELGPSNVTSAVIHHIRRFAEYGGVQHNECTLFPTIRDLLTNLTSSNEPPAPINIQNQIVQSPVGPVGSSPGPMMHSPMPPMGQGGPQQASYGMGPTTGPN